jgi:hypothetical protein
MPTGDTVLVASASRVGLGENPPHSNHNEVTDWYGADGPWCAMFVSWSLAHGGFTDDAGKTLHVNGIVQTTSHGWAYVPYLLNSFRTSGRVVADPRPGDIAIFQFYGPVDGPDHAGMVEKVLDSRTVATIEGNHNDRVERLNRDRSVIVAFCRPPYSDAPLPPVVPQASPPNGVPAFPGYCSRGSRDNATREVQKRLAQRGWTIYTDGIFGSQTDAAVRAFQSRKSLVVDGIVGPATWNALWQ